MQEMAATGLLETLSREFALSCDARGTILEADRRAERILGGIRGRRLRELAASGTEDKVDLLIENAVEREVRGWELVLCVDDRPATVSFSACPREERVVMVGSLLPEDYASSMGQLGETLSEIAALYRETERQRVEMDRQRREIVAVNRELRDLNQGVVALHAELEEQTAELRRSGEIRSRMVANVSHELKSPLATIQGLARLLLDRLDGDLTLEQDKQIRFILSAAEGLSELVNDLLDLSRLEAGRVPVRPRSFTARDLFTSQRGMLKPIMQKPEVELIFEEPDPDIELNTDEGKLSQILRNLVTNAYKFTERGFIRVRVTPGPFDRISFQVQDTGIGIAREDQGRIFEEFTQLDSSLQRKVKGTGLGLHISRRFAHLLGGSLTLESTPGRGTTFTLTIPRIHPEVSEIRELKERSARIEPGASPVLVVEDDHQTLFLYERFLSGSGFQVVPARSGDEARQIIARTLPAAIVLDIMLEGETTWRFLSELKADPRTRDIPVLVVTVTNREQKARALGADEFWLKPLDRQWLLKRLTALARPGTSQKILHIDDDETARYLFRKLLSGTGFQVIEASDGLEGIRLAREHQPQVIFLDFVLHDITAFDVLDELKMDPTTRNIPVIIHSSKDFEEEERRRLAAETAAILSKQNLSRELALGRIRDALTAAGLRLETGVKDTGG